MRSVRKTRPAAPLPRKKKGCWYAFAFPRACGRKGKTATLPQKTKGMPARPGSCAAAKTTIGVAGPAVRETGASNAPRIFSARTPNLTSYACPRARAGRAPWASSAFDSMKGLQSVPRCTAPTASSPPALKTGCAGCSRPRLTLERRGWSVSSGVGNSCRPVAPGRSAMRGCACRTATRRPLTRAARATGAGRAGQTRPLRAVRIGRGERGPTRPLS